MVVIVIAVVVVVMVMVVEVEVEVVVVVVEVEVEVVPLHKCGESLKLNRHQQLKSESDLHRFFALLHRHHTLPDCPHHAL